MEVLFQRPADRESNNLCVNYASAQRFTALGSQPQLLVDADVEKFWKRLSRLDEIMEIPVLKCEIVLPPKRKSKAKSEYSKNLKYFVRCGKLDVLTVKSGKDKNYLCSSPCCSVCSFVDYDAISVRCNYVLSMYN